MSGIKISDLPAAESASADMQLEVNDSGTSRRVTADQLKVFAAPLADQAEAEAGTDNEKLMTPLRTAEAIAELSPAPEQLSEAQVTDPDSEVFGTISGQQLAAAVDARTLAALVPAAYDTTQRPNNNTSHQNLTGVPIFVAITGRSSGNAFFVEISEDGSSGWIVVGRISTANIDVLTSAQFVVPPGWFYRANGSFGTGTNRNWTEWRPV